MYYIFGITKPSPSPRSTWQTRFVIVANIVLDSKGQRGYNACQTISTAGNGLLPIGSLKISPKLGDVFFTFDMAPVVVLQGSPVVLPHPASHLKHLVTIAIYYHFAICRLARIPNFRQAFVSDKPLVSASPIPERGLNRPLTLCYLRKVQSTWGKSPSGREERITIKKQTNRN